MTASQVSQSCLGHVRALWNAGVRLDRMKDILGLKGLGGSDVMELVRAAGCGDRHPTSRELLALSDGNEAAVVP